MSETEEKKPGPSAYNYCLYLLSGQDYSEYKIRQKMKLKGFESEVIDQTVETLKEKNYLRESEYKRLLAKKLVAKGYSDNLIRRKAGQERLEYEAGELRDAREESGLASETVVQKLVAKKMRGQSVPEDRDERRKLQEKLYRFVLSRGFSYDEAKRAVSAALSAPIED